MFDTCNCERSEDCLCAALSSYVHACAAKGVQLSGWRDGVCSECLHWRGDVSTLRGVRGTLAGSSRHSHGSQPRALCLLIPASQEPCILAITTSQTGMLS